MYQLPFDQWHRVAHLIDESVPFVTLTMLYQRRIDGRIWVDSVDHPQTVIAAFAKDFYAFGDLSRPEALGVLMSVEGSTPATPGLREALRAAWGGFTVEEVLLYTFPHSDAPDFTAPAGYDLVSVDSGNVALLKEFWKDEYPAHTIGDFIDVRDFLTHGFGAMVLHRASGKCVSACVAISVSRERADFGLDTLPAHGGKGLAKACSALAVRQALRRGLRPVWVTQSDNIASQRVAAAVGFTVQRKFEILGHIEVED